MLFAAVISLASIVTCGLGLLAIYLIWRSMDRRSVRNDLLLEVDRAMQQKDVAGLRRLRLLHSSSLSKIDDELPQRIDAYADDLYIQQDDETKFGVRCG